MQVFCFHIRFGINYGACFSQPRKLHVIIPARIYAEPMPKYNNSSNDGAWFDLEDDYNMLESTLRLRLQFFVGYLKSFKFIGISANDE